MTPDIQKAVAYLKEGDAGQAASFLQDMIDRMPEHATAHVLLAQAREALEEWDRALHAWREAVRLVPTSPVVFRGLERAARKANPLPGEPAKPEQDASTDIDSLIASLESARIVPRPDAASVPTPDLDDNIDDVASETLATIYASQQRYNEAARIYDVLAERRPGQAAAFREKAARLRSGETED